MTKRRSIAAVSTSVVERCRNYGMRVSSSDAVLEASVVRDTLAGAQEGHAGVHVQANLKTNVPSVFDLRTSLIERNFDTGVYLSTSTATLESFVVRDTRARPGDDRFGDGVAVLSHNGAASASLFDAHIENSARGALTVFGASVQFRDSVLRCQSIDLIGEEADARPYLLENLGGNRCGCPEAKNDCVIESAGFEPPLAIEPMR